MSKPELFPSLMKYTGSFDGQYESIPPYRRKDLSRIANFIAAGIHERRSAQLVFICTHNSRRSHMAQIWAQTAAYYYGIPGVLTFSGGTEATAFHPNAVNVMRNAGFQITVEEKGENPLYAVRYAKGEPALKIFSKRYDDPRNPADGFCAVMTCSEADQQCPVIPGAALRVPVSYQDPGVYDNTEKQDQAYRDRCYQIGVEMFYLFREVRIN